MRSLEPFPEVASRILTLAGKPEVIPDEIIEVVQTDPGVTAKVLKLTNSAYYGFQREIGSLWEAGNMLGVDALVNLVLTSSANRYFRHFGKARSDARNGLWYRSISQALASRLIAERFGYESPDRAYTAGLLQNIGEVVLDRFYSDALPRVRAEVAHGRTPLQAEKVILGMHHAEIGARLGSNWKLPLFLVDTIRFHHSPDQASIDPLLTSAVHLAETLLDLNQPGDLRLPHEVCEAALELTGLDPDDFGMIFHNLEAELARAQEWLIDEPA
ncbi:MAG: HDOD domain-containing protein [Planctomycetota bacterium]